MAGSLAGPLHLVSVKGRSAADANTDKEQLMRQRRPFFSIVLTLGLFLTLLPASSAAQDGVGKGVVRLALGVFEPEGDSLWHDITDRHYTGDTGDLRDAAIALDFRYPVLSWLSFFSSVSDFSGGVTRAPAPGSLPGGTSDSHRWSMDSTSLTAGVIVDPWRQRIVSPYIGAGAGILSWEMSSIGRLLILDDTGLPPLSFDGTYRSSGEELLSYLQAGVELRVSNRWSVFSEARWTQADGEALIPLSCLCIEKADIDLGGQELSGGLAFRF
jgi:hypothetical protein